MNARPSLVVVPVSGIRAQVSGIRFLISDPCQLIPKSERPGIAPGPSHSVMAMDLEIHSAAQSKSAVADFDICWNMASGMD